MLLTDKDCVTIRRFMESVSRQYGVELHVGGPWEYGAGNSVLQRFLVGYIVHNNPYCLYVKSNHTLLQHCVFAKQQLLRTLEEKGQICGMCHCGVMELVMPIRRDGAIIGYISAGGFRPEEHLLHRRLQRLTGQYGFREADLREIYDSSIPENRIPSQELQAALGTLALLFSSFADSLPIPEAPISGSSIEKKLLCQRALEYLNMKYAKPIRIADVAGFCNCSESHIQHLFRQICGMTIGEYLEELRIDKACMLLTETGLSVWQVATRVGYMDANYFSTVFSNRKKLSPTKFREAGNRITQINT